MKFSRYLLSLLLAFGGSATWAQSINVFDDAFFQAVDPEVPDDAIELLGFGRGGSFALDVYPFARSAVETPSGDVREVFFDTWNVDTSLVAPGQYSFSNLTIEATGSLLFNSFVFNSYDAAEPAQLQSVLFTISDDGTRATGSGTFTVRSECPVASCVWIQIIGTQDIDDELRGYGGDNLIATAVPEPASWALLALGLAVVGGVARRRQA